MDSELVKEVEMFLEEHKIDILEMVYNRSIELDNKPNFQILTNNPKSLEKLAQKLKRSLRSDYDERSFYKELSISRDEYDLNICHRKKF